MPRLSRSLLTPGPLAPLSHFGGTLLRHVVATGLRYSFYQLGLAIPEAAPVRFVRLRLFLDAEPLHELVHGQPGGEEVLGAVLSPGGIGEEVDGAGRLKAALGFHRLRQRLLGARGRSRQRRWPGPGSGRAPGPESRAELWGLVREQLDLRLPYLCDIILAEVMESQRRRRLRRRGRELPRVLGPQARRLIQGGTAKLSSLGPPDPLAPSWAENGVDPGEMKSGLAEGQQTVAGGRRGAFREEYRQLLSELRPILLDLGRLCVEDGLLDLADGVFFIPFDLGDALTSTTAAAWLGPAIAANRREREALLPEPEHRDELRVSAALADLDDLSSQWQIAPLLPLD